MTFATRRKGLSRLGARLRTGQEARIVAFGGSLTYDGYYLASLARTLTKAYSSAIIEIATRGLPGWNSVQAVHRTRSVRDLNSDLIVVEFAFEDVRRPSQRIAQAVEGIVRQLRASDPDREMAFVYFGTPAQVEDGSMDRVVANWEDVAEHYGIPSFDGNALASQLVAQGQAIWFERWPGRRTWDERRPIALMQGDGYHTTLGGTIFGSQVAQSMITMFNPSSLLTESELPKEMDAANFGDAILVDGSKLNGDGWVGGAIADILATKPITVYFDQLAAAERAGARVRITFNGRYARLWTIGTGGTIGVVLDGRTMKFSPPADDLPHADELLDERKNRRHVLEIEALTLPAVIAGVDVLGQVLPESASNG